jgi:C-terminal of NADH-ubiquinone oxidoreductase 21 kDa subunit
MKRRTLNINADRYWLAVRLYGWTENNREVEMDMREMVDKVKKGEPLYGTSSMTPYMQGVAARNSRYSALMAQVIPWANFVNHNQVSRREPGSTVLNTNKTIARR